MCELAAETSLRSIPGTFGRLVKRSFSVSTVWTRIGRIGDAAVYKLTLRYVTSGRGDCGARCTVTCVAWTQIKTPLGASSRNYREDVWLCIARCVKRDRDASRMRCGRTPLVRLVVNFVVRLVLQ